MKVLSFCSSIVEVSVLVYNGAVQMDDCFAVHSQYHGNGHAYWRDGKPLNRNFSNTCVAVENSAYLFLN